eukprot:323697-Chlamydomonas_euryale.AAC.6
MQAPHHRHLDNGCTPVLGISTIHGHVHNSILLRASPSSVALVPSAESTARGRFADPPGRGHKLSIRPQHTMGEAIRYKSSTCNGRAVYARVMHYGSLGLHRQTSIHLRTLTPSPDVKPAGCDDGVPRPYPGDVT